MKSNYAPVGAKLIKDPDLQQRVGSAVWLFLYLVLNRDWKTGTLNRRVETMADDLKRNRKQIQRWLRTLEEEGVITTRRLWHGYFIQISDQFVMGQESPITPGEPRDKTMPVMGQNDARNGTSESHQPENIQLASDGKETDKKPSWDANVPTIQSLCQKSLSTPPSPPPAGGVDFPDEDEPEKKWAQCMKILEAKLIPENFNTWFVPTYPLVMEPGRVVIAVPNRVFKKCLEENYSREIKDALASVGIKPAPKLEFLTKDQYELVDA